MTGTTKVAGNAANLVIAVDPLLGGRTTLASIAENSNVARNTLPRRKIATVTLS
jgi:hypothetical protein